MQHSIGIVVSIKCIHHYNVPVSIRTGDENVRVSKRSRAQTHTNTHITFRLAVSENCLHILRILCVAFFVVWVLFMYITKSPAPINVLRVERVRENCMHKTNETSFSSYGHQRLFWCYSVRCSILLPFLIFENKAHVNGTFYSVLLARFGGFLFRWFYHFECKSYNNKQIFLVSSQIDVATFTAFAMFVAVCVYVYLC